VQKFNTFIAKIDKLKILVKFQKTSTLEKLNKRMPNIEVTDLAIVVEISLVSGDLFVFDVWAYFFLNWISTVHCKL